MITYTKTINSDYTIQNIATSINSAKNWHPLEKHIILSHCTHM